MLEEESNMDKPFLDKEELDRDTVESKCGAGCGLNLGLLLNARLKGKKLYLGQCSK